MGAVRRISPRLAVVLIAVGILAGVLTAFLAERSRPSNRASDVRNVVAPPKANAQPAPGPRVKDVGDAAIQWQSLPAGGTSELAAVGGDLYVVVSPANDASVLYRLADGNRIRSAVATIPPQTVTSLTAINGKLLVAGDQSLVLVDPATGSATTVQLKMPPGLESKAPAPKSIAAVAAIGTRAYVVEYDSNEMQVVPVFEGRSSQPGIQFSPEITSIVGLPGSGVALLATAGTTRVGFITGGG